jgi:hypothetical protein
MRELKEIIEEYLTKTVHMSLATVSGGGVNLGFAKCTLFTTGI